MEPEEKDRKLRTRIMEESVIYLSPILGGVLFFILQRIAVRELFVQIVLSVLASSAFSLFFRIHQGFYRSRLQHPMYFFGCYMLSFLWMGLSGIEQQGCMWFLVVIFAALDAGAELAVFTQMLLMLSYAWITMQTTADFRVFIAYFTLGMVMAVLFSVLRRWWEAGYLFLILLFFDAACRIFIYDFSLQAFFQHGQAFLQEVVSILAFTLIGVFYATFLSTELRVERYVVRSMIMHKQIHQEMEEAEKEESIVKKEPVKEETEPEIIEPVKAETEPEIIEPVKAETETESEIIEPVKEETEPEQTEPVKAEMEPEQIEPVKAETETESEIIEPVKEDSEEPVEEFQAVSDEEDISDKKMPTETNILQKIIQPNFPLVKRLREYSEALYKHSERISALAGGAAELVNADVLLARAGGLYHEIGRITPSGNYILTGEKIAKEAGFPTSLLPVIRQHSPIFELPKSREAAVVMLSDSIISTEEYLIKNGQREQVTDEHLIRNIFQKRISKGNLKGVDFSTGEIEQLKEYFIKNISS